MSFLDDLQKAKNYDQLKLFVYSASFYDHGNLDRAHLFEYIDQMPMICNEKKYEVRMDSQFLVWLVRPAFTGVDAPILTVLDLDQIYYVISSSDCTGDSHIFIYLRNSDLGDYFSADMQAFTQYIRKIGLERILDKEKNEVPERYLRIFHLGWLDFVVNDQHNFSKITSLLLPYSKGFSEYKSPNEPFIIDGAIVDNMTIEKVKIEVNSQSILLRRRKLFSKEFSKVRVLVPHIQDIVCCEQFHDDGDSEHFDRVFTLALKLANGKVVYLSTANEDGDIIQMYQLALEIKSRVPRVEYF
ncbi:MAG: hypothetical protein IJW62_03200 [Clostridia bacterium]|nr:hypothetical protein [Clostridia bacterium]